MARSLPSSPPWTPSPHNSLPSKLHRSFFFTLSSACFAFLSHVSHLVVYLLNYFYSCSLCVCSSFLSRMAVFEDFFHHRNIPPDIVDRIRRYFEHQWSATKGVSPEKVLDDLPLQIRSSIMHHVCHDLVRTLPLFEGASDRLITKVSNLPSLFPCFISFFCLPWPSFLLNLFFPCYCVSQTDRETGMSKASGTQGFRFLCVFLLCLLPDSCYSSAQSVLLCCFLSSVSFCFALSGCVSFDIRVLSSARIHHSERAYRQVRTVEKLRSRRKRKRKRKRNWRR